MEFFTNGKAGFKYLEQAIDEAKDKVEIQMFIWRDDQLGRRLLESVQKAADRGVLVTVNKDQLGAVFELAEESRKSLIHDRIPFKLLLKSLGIHWTYPMKGKPRRCYLVDKESVETLKNHPNITINNNKNLSDHTKCIIIDDRQLIISGMNFEEKEYSQDLLGRCYFDYMLAVESEEAVALFRNDDDRIHRDLKIPSMTFDIIRNSAKGFHVKDGLLDRLSQVEARLDIVMAYLGYGEINRKLVDLCKAGIELNLYIPVKANLQSDLNLRMAADLFKRTNEKANIYLCHQMIHGKLIMVDGDYVTFGSSNLNRQAMEVLGESNIGFFSREYGVDEQILASIESIRAESVQVKRYGDIKYNLIKALLEGLV